MHVTHRQASIRHVGAISFIRHVTAYYTTALLRSIYSILFETTYTHLSLRFPQSQHTTSTYSFSVTRQVTSAVLKVVLLLPAGKTGATSRRRLTRAPPIVLKVVPPTGCSPVALIAATRSSRKMPKRPSTLRLRNVKRSVTMVTKHARRSVTRVRTFQQRRCK